MNMHIIRSAAIGFLHKHIPMVYKTAFSFMIMDDNVTVLSMNVR